VFINLETDPRILHSSPHHACVNLPPPIAFRLPFTSALGHYSDSRSRPCSDTPRTPTHVHTRTPAHIRARMLLGLLLTSVLGLYSEPHSSSVIHPPPCNPIFMYTDLTRSSVSIRATSSWNSTRTLRSGVPSDIRVSICLTSTSPHLRTPFGPPSLSVLQSEPLPSNSARRSAQTSARTSVSRSVL
jgi:hypothetical protein